MGLKCDTGREKRESEELTVVGAESARDGSRLLDDHRDSWSHAFQVRNAKARGEWLI